jgi:putative transport protein
MSITMISQEALEFSIHVYRTGLQDMGTYLIHNAVLAVFFCLFLGYLIGKTKIKSFTVGATVGTLFCGLVLSLSLASFGRFEIDGLVKTIFFSLFIFTIGYEVGPAFFNSLGKSGIKIIIFSVFLAFIAFVTALVLFKILHTDPGEAAGILAGSLTQSAILGTSDSSLKELLTGEQLSSAQGNMAVAYALTYVFGTVGMIVFVRNIAPVLCGINLKEATKHKIEEVNYKETSKVSQTISVVKARAFLVKQDSVYIGEDIVNIEHQFKGHLTFEKIIRNEQSIPLGPHVLIQKNDQITLIGALDSMISFENSGLIEISDAQSVIVSLVERKIFLTRGFDSDILKKMAEQGVYLSEVVRNGISIAIPDIFQVNDELTLMGPKNIITNIQKRVGYAKDTGEATDVSFLSIGIVLGLCIGAFAFNIKNVPLTLGSGGGALIAGLVFGWYQNKHQNHGCIPSATRWFLKSVGLNLFIAIVGLNAGADFIAALWSMGLTVLIVGAVIAIVPPLITVYFGRFILKMDPIDILGALTGAQTITAALNGLVEETGSSIFAISYTPAYAIGNVLLTILGPLIVVLLI